MNSDLPGSALFARIKHPVLHPDPVLPPLVRRDVVSSDRQPGTLIVPCTASSWLARQARTEPFACIRRVRLCDLLAGSYNSVPVPICVLFDFIIYSTFIWQCFLTLSRSFEF